MMERQPLYIRAFVLTVSTLLCCAGCGNRIEFGGAPLFVAPLEIEGTPVGHAIIDTGGAYEFMLRDAFGLNIVSETDVLAFAGRQRVGVTEGFAFTAGGFDGEAISAIVSSEICDCNGLGYLFFRRTGIVLALDFANGLARFQYDESAVGSRIPFASPPAAVAHFDTSFIEVDLESGGERRTVLALLDTGSNGTVLRRGLFHRESSLFPNRLQITLSRTELGSLSLRAALFDTPGLPDLIIGTDVMRAWADQWYFRFDDRGGSVSVVHHAPESNGVLDGSTSSAQAVDPTRTRIGSMLTPDDR